MKKKNRTKTFIPTFRNKIGMRSKILTNHRQFNSINTNMVTLSISFCYSPVDSSNEAKDVNKNQKMALQVRILWVCHGMAWDFRSD